MQRRMRRLGRFDITPSLINREVWLEKTDTFATVKTIEPNLMHPIQVEGFPGSGYFSPSLTSGIYLLDPDEPGQVFYGRSTVTWSEKT